MVFFLVALCLIAPSIILFVNPSNSYNPVTAFYMQDGIVLPRLAATAAFTGGGLIWGGVLLARDRWPRGRLPATLWIAVIAFVVVNLLAFAFAADWRASLMGEDLRYQGLAATLVYVLLFGVAAVAVRTTRDLRWLLLGLFGGALVAASYALIQKAGWDWVDWTGQSTGRPFGTMGQANVLGAFLVAAISGSAVLALTAKERWQQALLGAGLVMMLFALFFTVSRSAYLAGGVVVLIWGAAAVRWLLPALTGWGDGERGEQEGAPDRRRQLAFRIGIASIAVAPVVLALVAVFFVGLPQGRIAVFSSGNDQALDQRLGLWQLGLEMIADQPLLGHGQDGFSVQFPSYRDRPDLQGIGTQSLDPESTHNFFLDLATGTGLLGLVSFLALVGAVLWHAGRRALATDDAALRIGLVGLSGGVLGYLAAVFFGFSEAMTTWVLWLFLGAMAGLVVRAPAETPSAPPRRKKGRRKEPPPPAESGTLASGMAAVGLSLLGAIALVWAATITGADLASGQADAAAGRGEYAAAVRLSDRAATQNPLRKEYLFQKAEAYQRWSDADAPDPEEAMRLSVENYQTLVSRYKATAFNVLSLAVVTNDLALLQGTSAIEETSVLLERAVALDPFSKPLRDSVVGIYRSLGLNDRSREHQQEIFCWTVGECD
ncbi:MAG: O-antigen ligase family protein [Chloroflexi bacterium]|nr:O-antigen ligase family protein [Chloroflexota bacterium]